MIIRNENFLVKLLQKTILVDQTLFRICNEEDDDSS